MIRRRLALLLLVALAAVLVRRWREPVAGSGHWRAVRQPDNQTTGTVRSSVWFDEPGGGW